MKKIQLITLALLCLFLTACWNDDDPYIPPPVTDPEVKALSDSLTALYENSAIPGFAVTIVKDNEIAYQKTFGQSNVFFDIEYTNQTTQPIGSVSKTFIAVALMKAIEQGHFTLETNINDILPFEVINPHTPTIPIQIKHLVTHTSGLFDSQEAYTLNYHILPGQDLNTPIAQVLLAYDIDVNDGMPLGEYLKKVFTPTGDFYDEENFHTAGPNAEYEYGNIAASLAAYLIEAKTGISYADYVKQYILQPLEMNRSTLNRLQVNQTKSSLLYISKDNPLPEYAHPSYPDGFMHTSNYDMGLYLLEMMKGSEGTGTILTNDSYEKMFSAQSSIIDFHGVFWDLVDGRIEHSGADPGVLTLFSFDPIKKTGYYIMTNINGDGLGEDVGVDDSIAPDQFFEALRLVKDFEMK